MRALLFSLLAAACVSAPAPEQVDPGPVIAAERAFAARAGEVGWIPAFREYAAPDGQLAGSAGFVSAPQQLAALEDDGERNLFWAPVFAGIARSGDLGFTTGPASFDAARTATIQYFTVWRLQPDGSWKWIYDGGPGAVADPGPYLAEGARPQTLPVATSGVGTAKIAVEQVASIEDGADSSELQRRLAPTAHVYRTGRARAFGGADSAARMTDPSGEVTYRRLRAEGSASGDLVFTLGEANWQSDGAMYRGLFARIWQHQAQGWAIVYDQLSDPRPAEN